MISATVQTITAMQAQAEAFRFLNDHLPDRIIAATPHLDAMARVWRVPAVLSHPGIGIIGQVGEVIISAETEQVVSHTPVEEMRASALALAEQNRDAIEAPIL